MRGMYKREQTHVLPFTVLESDARAPRANFFRILLDRQQSGYGNDGVARRDGQVQEGKTGASLRIGRGGITTASTAAAQIIAANPWRKQERS